MRIVRRVEFARENLNSQVVRERVPGDWIFLRWGGQDNCRIWEVRDFEGCRSIVLAERLGAGAARALGRVEGEGTGQLLAPFPPLPRRF